MKKSKKFLLAIGAFAATAAPVASIIACSSNDGTTTTTGTTDKTDLNNGKVTVETVKMAIEKLTIAVTDRKEVKASTKAETFNLENIGKYFTKRASKGGKSGYVNKKGTKEPGVLPELAEGMIVTFEWASIKNGETKEATVTITDKDKKTAIAKLEISVNDLYAIDQEDIDASKAMKKFITDQLGIYNSLSADSEKDKNIFYVEEAGKYKTNRLWIGATKADLLANIRATIEVSGFDNKIDNITEMKVGDKVITDKYGKINTMFGVKKLGNQVGYKNKKADGSFEYTIYLTDTAKYPSASAAADAYITAIDGMIKSDKKVDYLIKDKYWNLLYWANLYKIGDTVYPNIVKLIRAGNQALATGIENFLGRFSTTARARIQFIVNKYVPGGVDGNSFDETQVGVVWNNFISWEKGSSSHGQSSKVVTSGQVLNSTKDGFMDYEDMKKELNKGVYIETYGVMPNSKEQIDGLNKTLLGEVLASAEAKAFLGSGLRDNKYNEIQKVHSKLIGYVLVKFGGKWFMASDVVRYLVDKESSSAKVFKAVIHDYFKAGSHKESFDKVVAALETRYPEVSSYLSQNIFS